MPVSNQLPVEPNTWCCCRQTKLQGVRACSPDVSWGVHPLRLIRLIRGSNLVGWHWTLRSMKLSSENSQDGWVLHSPEQLRPACSSNSLTWERLGRAGLWLRYCVSVLNQTADSKRPSRIGYSETFLKHIFILFFDVILCLFNLTSFHRMKLPKNFKSKQSTYKSGAELINRSSNRRSYSAPAWISEFESNPLKWLERDVGTEILVLTSSANDQKRKCCFQWPYCYPHQCCISLLFLILVWAWNIQFSPIPGTSLPLISCLSNSRLLFKLCSSASPVPLHIAVLSPAVFPRIIFSSLLLLSQTSPLCL